MSCHLLYIYCERRIVCAKLVKIGVCAAELGLDVAVAYRPRVLKLSLISCVLHAD